MPYKPRNPVLTKAAHGKYCPEHQKLAAQQHEKYQRDPATRKRYGRVWQRIRAKYVAAHPLCEQCLKDGKYTPVEEVHHILPRSKGGTHASDNLMSLCTVCHSAISAKEGDRWG